MKVICQKAKDGKCAIECSHSKPHDDFRCAFTGKPFSGKGSKCSDSECVPVVPEYVRVTQSGEVSVDKFTFYYHSGDVHKVRGDAVTRWLVSAIITDENDPCYIRKAHCEPCEAPEHIPTPYYGSHEHHVALNVEYQRKLKKGDTKMKYKQLKPISLELLWNAQPDKERHEFLVEWGMFMNWFAADVKNLRSGSTVSFYRATWAERAVIEFFDAMKKHDHGSVWLYYMEKHGFIEKESEPVIVTLQIKDEKDAKGLLRDLDKSCRAYLYYQLLDQLQSQGVKI